MSTFKNISIKNKLIIIIISTSIITVVAGLFTYLIFDMVSVRNEIRKNAILNATLVGQYSAVPLIFNYKDEAKDVLSKLNSIPSVLDACTYSANGEIFAVYHKTPQNQYSFPVSGINKTGFSKGFLHVYQPITYKDKNYGTLYLRISTSTIQEKFRNNVMVMCGLVLLLLITMYIIANRLQRLISKPILNLAELTATISKNHDFTVQLKPQGNDEVGILYQQFNNLLSQLLKRQNERDKAEEEIVKINRVYVVLSNINQAIVHIRVKQELLDKICRIAIDDGKFIMAWIGMVNPKTNKFNIVASYGKTDGYLDNINIDLNDNIYSQGPTGKAIKTGMHIYCNDISNDEMMIPWREEAQINGYKSSIALPLNISGKLTGAFTLYSSEYNYFNEAETELLDKLAMDVSYALEFIENESVRKQMEENLRINENQLSAIFNTISDILYFISVEPNETYRFVSVNEMFLKATGLNKEQIINKTINEVLPPSAHELVLGKYREAIETKQTVFWEEVSDYPAGKKYGLVKVTPTYNEHGICTNLVGSVHDITAIRESENEIRQLNAVLEKRVNERTAQLATINKELESFSYSISHDLRAPLRAINGFSQILSVRHRESLNDEGRQYMDYILEASKRMERLINDLLNYSRLGRKSLDMHPVSLNAIVNNIYLDFNQQLKDIGAKFVTDKELPQIMGDETLLRQIFTNLIGNAITYRRVNVPLIINITCEKFANEYIIKVTDNGIGISKEYWEKIFNVFQRLHSEDEYPGTGIGLATVKKAVGMIGGTVWVESVVDEGSTFFIKISELKI